MRKEEWLLKEIESWQSRDIINEEVAHALKSMYQPRKTLEF